MKLEISKKVTIPSERLAPLINIENLRIILMIMSNLLRHSDEMKEIYMEKNAKSGEMSGLYFEIMLIWFLDPKCDPIMHLFASILQSLTASKEIRKFILSKTKPETLLKVSEQIKHPVRVRRLGVLGFTRNLAFEYNNEIWRKELETKEFYFKAYVDVLHHLTLRVIDHYKKKADEPIHKTLKIDPVFFATLK